MKKNSAARGHTLPLPRRPVRTTTARPEVPLKDNLGVGLAVMALWPVGTAASTEG